jgi:hypothetical protein
VTFFLICIFAGPSPKDESGCRSQPPLLFRGE